MADFRVGLRSTIKTNLGKDQTGTFTSSRTDMMMSVNHGRETLASTEETLFLGIVVDSHCTWKAHVSYLLNRLCDYADALRRETEVAGVGAALSAYYACAQSRLQYGLLFWGGSVEMDRLLLFQKRCIRNTFGLRRTDLRLNSSATCRVKCATRWKTLNTDCF